MIEKLLQRIGERYPLTSMPVGEFACTRVGGMTFVIEAYHAEGLGHVSVMCASGFFGLMKMQTLIVNPCEKDLPLYSYDRIFALGNDTLIVELYDTATVPMDESAMIAARDAYASIPERDPGEHWYDGIKLPSSISKKGKRKADTQPLNTLTEEHFLRYLDAAPVSAPDAAVKAEKTAVYVEGLLMKGGPSTDAFKKAIGDEKTTTLFRKYLFGTEK